MTPHRGLTIFAWAEFYFWHEEQEEDNEGDEVVPVHLLGSDQDALRQHLSMPEELSNPGGSVLTQ